jgi:hypothetical protein
MRRRHPISAGVVASLLLALLLPACSRTAKPYDPAKDFADAMLRKALYRPPSAGGPPGKIILPDPKVIRCSTSNCPPVLPDGKDPRVVYPWQVSLDYNNGSVIGLTALYDDPTSVNDVRTAVNERWGKFALKSNGKILENLWRVEPEQLAISLSTNEYGMVQLIYLTFDARHPTSEKATQRFLDRWEKDENQ